MLVFGSLVVEYNTWNAWVPSPTRRFLSECHVEAYLFAYENPVSIFRATQTQNDHEMTDTAIPRSYDDKAGNVPAPTVPTVDNPTMNHEPQ